MGPKMQGYIAMQALGLGLVCESMPFLAYREAVGVGLPVLNGCTGVLDACETGDELEVDFSTGRVSNLSRQTSNQYPPVPPALREIIALGGTTAWLRQWWARRDAA